MQWSVPTRLLMIACVLCTGCATVGPRSISNGRMAYNDAIVATNNEQMLAMIVRMRYQEPVGLLAVAGVTASMRLQATAGAQFGVGAQSTFEGNLVPLAAGATYEENPTISYTPVQGENYLRQLLSPIPLDLTILLLNAMGDSPLGTTLLVRRINGVRNPDFPPDHPADSSGDASDAETRRFARVAELFASLHRMGSLSWVQEKGEKPALAMLLQGSGDEHARRVNELSELLDLGVPQEIDHTIILPVDLGIGVRPKGTIELETRSAYDLFQVAAAAVDVPPEHLESGLARSLPQTGLAARSIRIVRSDKRPADALTAIRHHGYWYSIDGHDQQSKAVFRLLEALMSARLADSADTRAAMPILTIPASR